MYLEPQPSQTKPYKKFIIPVAIAVALAAIFTVAYFGNKRIPDGGAPAVEQTESQPENNTGQETAETMSATSSQEGNTPEENGPLPETELPLPETNSANAAQTTAPAQTPAAAKPSAPAPKLDSAGAASRDQQRQTDMRRFAGAQTLWYGDHKRYYTCSTTGGDCQGKPRNLPVTIGSAGVAATDPANVGSVCGRDYIYCGLDNTRDSSKYCYFAKLEGGGYYTATASGNFERGTAPATFAECAQATY
jgi:hypothetical protein